jgi:hypothetical protein
MIFGGALMMWYFPKHSYWVDFSSFSARRAVGAFPDTPSYMKSLMSMLAVTKGGGTC